MEFYFENCRGSSHTQRFQCTCLQIIPASLHHNSLRMQFEEPKLTYNIQVEKQEVNELIRQEAEANWYIIGAHLF